MTRAVHFGAGNIGRGFVGLLLHQAGIEVVFADVSDQLITDLQNSDSYTVNEVGSAPTATVVSGYTAVNSASDADAAVEEIAGADIVTTAVGAHILPYLADTIARGIAARPDGSPPLAVMACENAVNATDVLEREVRAIYEGGDVDDRARFANTAVDRIVPAQDPDAGLDVTVESFREWVADRRPFAGNEPGIPGITWVDDLVPYIERKLFTVNTGHAATAWHGWAAGFTRIADAISERKIRARVASTLTETSALLVSKHGFAAGQQQAYVSTILGRFGNPYLHDTTERVGRQPARKLSRNERIIGPAAGLAERGLDHGSLLQAFAAGLRFAPDGDEEAQQVQQLLAGGDADAVTSALTGLEPSHPLYIDVREVVAVRIAEL